MQAMEAVQPRPMPTAWTTRVVNFSNGSERRVMIELTLLTPGGAHVTFWAPGDLSRFTSDLRSVTKQASQEQSGIWTPGDEGPGSIVLPPTGG